MFSFFRKKEKEPASKDLVFITASAKQKAVAEFMNSNPDTLLLVWFEESYEEAVQLMPSMEARIFMTRTINGSPLQNHPVIFYEHHPLVSKEKSWLEENQLQEAVFYSSLDEPLFLFAGGANIARLMQKMGMQEEEAISHSLISKSIDGARKKLADKVMSATSARSQKEWFERNVPEHKS